MMRTTCPVDLSCSIVWGWRESMIKALSPFDVMKTIKSTSSSSSKNSSPRPARAFHMTQLQLREVALETAPSEAASSLVSSSPLLYLCCPSVRVVGANALADMKESDSSCSSLVVGETVKDLMLGAAVFPRPASAPVVVTWAVA